MSAPNSIVNVGAARFGNALPLALIAGPCQLESRAHALEMASALKEIAGRLGIGLVYKTSFDKANRTSAKARAASGSMTRCRSSPRSARAWKLPVLTDVHDARSVRARGRRSVDVLQIPAFLCRQTDLLIAAAEHRPRRQREERPVPRALGHEERRREDHRRRQRQRARHRARRLLRLQHAGLRHARAAGAGETGAPVIFDATHSVQQPGGQGTSSGGQREFVPVLARAAVAVGVAGVFIETHQDPDHAPSDGPNMIPIKTLEALLRTLDRVRRARQISMKA